MKPLVTIIVPVYNAQTSLSQCISSILKQSYPNIELVLIDDGSSDDSGKICDQYTADRRVQIFHKKNAGVSAARNDGIRLAKGEFISFVDSDDVIEKDMVEKLMERQMVSHADLVVCTYIRDNGSQTLKVEITEGLFENYRNSDRITELYQRTLINSPCAKIYKKSLITEYFDETLSLGEDILFNLEYLKNVKYIDVLNYAGYRYNISSIRGLHISYRENSIKDFIRIWEETDRYFQGCSDDRLVNAAKARLLVNLYGALESCFISVSDKNVRKKLLENVLDKTNAKRVSDTDCVGMSKRIKLLQHCIKHNNLKLAYCMCSTIALAKKCANRVRK